VSILSKVTGIHISPHGVHIEPLKALGTVAALGSLGALGPLSGALQAIPGAGAVAGAASKVGSIASKVPGVAKIGDFLGSHGGVGGLVKAGLGYAKDHPMDILAGAEGVNSALQQKQATNYAKDAAGAVTGSYNERAPLRVAGLKQLLNPDLPDTSFVGDAPGNAYSRKRVAPLNAGSVN
jgi:hypothetical protein